MALGHAAARSPGRSRMVFCSRERNLQANPGSWPRQTAYVRTVKTASGAAAVVLGDQRNRSHRPRSWRFAPLSVARTAPGTRGAPRPRPPPRTRWSARAPSARCRRSGWPGTWRRQPKPRRSCPLPAYPLNLRQPRLRPAHQPGQHRLRQAPAAPVSRDPRPRRALVPAHHVTSCVAAAGSAAVTSAHDGSRDS
jgi:hypothetical protein